MALLVQKYGGTSVGTVARIQRVARRVLKAQKAGHHVEGVFMKNWEGDASWPWPTKSLAVPMVASATCSFPRGSR